MQNLVAVSYTMCNGDSALGTGDVSLTRVTMVSLEVIGTDTDRSATYDFLSVISVKIFSFPTPVHLTPTLRD